MLAGINQSNATAATCYHQLVQTESDTLATHIETEGRCLAAWMISPVRFSHLRFDGIFWEVLASMNACHCVNCLINSGTTPVWKHLLSIDFVYLIYLSVFIILAVTCISECTVQQQPVKQVSVSVSLQ